MWIIESVADAGETRGLFVAPGSSGWYLYFAWDGTDKGTERRSSRTWLQTPFLSIPPCHSRIALLHWIIPPYTLRAGK